MKFFIKKNYFISFFIFYSAFIFNAEAKRMTIFACEPEWGALAREIVGEKADVVVATRAFTNPSLRVEKDFKLLSSMMKADVVFCAGGGLEDAWLPALLKNSSSKEIKSGKAVLMAYDCIKPLHKNAAGEKNNERIHLNPNNLLTIAPKFLEIMLFIDVENATFYRQYYQNFDKKLRAQIISWQERAQSLKGMKVALRNDAWAYLVDWLSLDVVLKIEDEKGVDKNLYEMQKLLEKNPAKVIIFADFEKKQIIYDLSKKTKIRVVLLPFTVGGTIGAKDIFYLYENTINRLLTDCSKTTCQNIGVRPVMDYLSPNQTIVDQAN